jgi:hypothetical protein
MTLELEWIWKDVAFHQSMHYDNIFEGTGENTKILFQDRRCACPASIRAPTEYKFRTSRLHKHVLFYQYYLLINIKKFAGKYLFLLCILENDVEIVKKCGSTKLEPQKM